MKVAIVVQGRFHAFDLAKALKARGHDVTVFTNYPKWATSRFGLEPGQVRTFWPHGVISRVAFGLHDRRLAADPSRHLLPMFGRWAAKELARERWDVIHTWSGASEEILQSTEGTVRTRMIMRGSAHIRTQLRLLEQEEARTNISLDKPNGWIVAREEREYALADRIVTLSSFARDSFLAEGIPAAKLAMIPLGASHEMFRPADAVVAERCRRIASGDPLRVLFVGTLAYRKGLHDLISMIRTLAKESFPFEVVGDVPPEAADAVRALKAYCTVTPRQPQHDLPACYARGDVFVFPTIEDGFAAVLSQAATAALPILSTPNCGAPEVIREGETGWILPIRDPNAFVDRLRWCHGNRERLAAMVKSCHIQSAAREWDEVARDFEIVCGTAAPDLLVTS